MRCNTPKSAKRKGSSRQERGRWANIRLRTDGQTVRGSVTPCLTSPRRAPAVTHQWAGQFMGLRERRSAPVAKENMWGL